MIKSDTTLAPWQYLEMAQEFVSQEKLTEALTLLREAIVLHPDRAELYREMGMVQEQIGDFAGEIASYQKAIELEEQPDWIYPTLADLLWRDGQLESAIAVCQKGLALHPHHALLSERLTVFWQEQQALDQASASSRTADLGLLRQYCAQAKQLVAQEQYQDAIACYEAAIAAYPEQAELYRELGVVQEKIGDFAGEQLSYCQAIALDLNQPIWVYLVAGRLLREQENFTDAIAVYQNALQQYPEQAEVYRELGIAQEKIGDISGEIASYRQAIALQPQQPEWLYLTLIGLLNKTEQTDEIAPLCKSCLASADLKPETRAVISAALVETWMRQGEYEQAIAYYEQALETEPHNCHYLTDLGRAYTETEQWDKAIDCYQQAIALNPQEACYHAWLGKVFTLQQQGHVARSCYRKAIAIDSQSIEVLTIAAAGFAQEGDWGEAIVICNKLLQLQPKNQECSHQLQELRRRQQTEPDAQAHSRLSDAEVILQSGLFDESYYLTQYPDVVASGIAPLDHYMRLGATQGYNPNPFFQSAYYLQENPDVAEDALNPLVHYLRRGAAEKRSLHPLFDAAFYLEQYADVAASGINPLVHYYFYGLAEERVAFSVDRIRAAIHCSQDINTAPSRLGRSPDFPDRPLLNGIREQAKIGIYCSSGGNYFMAEIADLIAAGFEQIGLTAVRLDETDDRPDDLDLDVIVAPHEFFYLGAGEALRKADWVSQAILVNVEQPHTHWFAKAFPFLRRARFVLDINVKSAVLLNQLGVRADFLPLGYLPNYPTFQPSPALPDLLALKGLPRAAHTFVPDAQAPLTQRPIDLLFIGTVNERRKRFLAESASWLSRYQCFLHIPPIETPLLRGEGQALDTQAVVGLSQRSKILLNVHREELPYFEWHRIVFHGLWQRTLVLTETCHDVPGLVAGTHFIQCPLDEMKDTVEWLLNTREGQAEAERIRQAGHRSLRENLLLEESLKQIFCRMSGAAV